ncbi:Intracellular distribution of mitochondria, partial [Coemansia aciculifera]
MTPVDVEFLESECKEGVDHPEYPHRLVMLRPELVDIYWERQFRTAVHEEMERKKNKREEEEKEKEKEKEGGQKKEEVEEEEERKEMEDFKFSLDFNPDAFTPLGGAGAEGDDAAVRGASRFVRDVCVPALARELASYISTPLSGSALTTTMHQRGINMRYLGRIATLLSSSATEGADASVISNVRRLVVFEMIARAAKHILRRLFRLSPAASTHAEVFALVANCLVGTKFSPRPAQHLLSAATARRVPALAELTAESLASEVCAQVALRFRYTLAPDFVASFVSGHELTLLRELCAKAGVQIALRQYYFEPPTEATAHAAVMASLDALAASKMHTKPVRRLVKERVDQLLARPLAIFADDVMCFVARTKVASSQKSVIADSAFEAGRMALERGERALGLDLLLESLALHEQTFGFLHSESARCYAVVALAHYDAGEHALAAEFMAKAV